MFYSLSLSKFGIYLAKLLNLIYYYKAAFGDYFENDINLPRTKMTGTFGASNCTDVSFCMGNFPVEGIT